MNLSGNTILVTGATSGIGRALAQALHARGNQVVVAGRRQDQLDRLARETPGIQSLPLDVDDPAAVARLRETVDARFPTLDVLFANAGISRQEDMASGAWTTVDAEAIVATNILGTLRVVSALLPTLMRRPRAALVVTTSNLAFIPRADFPAYCASKAFLHSWLQSLRHQLRNNPVEVLELSPPYVQTELTGPGQAVDPRAMPLPAYVAEVMQLLEAGNHPAGEVLVAYDRARRTAEREGRYDEAFAAINPA